MLRAFFRDGRLTEIPSKASKRRIVLERIAIEFEPGRSLRRTRGQRDRRRLLPRPRGAPPLPRRRRVPGPGARRLLAGRRASRRVSRLDATRSHPGTVHESRRAGPSHRRFRTFTTDLLRSTRTRSAIAVLAIITGMLFGAAPAFAHHAPGPCDFHRRRRRVDPSLREAADRLRGGAVRSGPGRTGAGDLHRPARERPRPVRDVGRRRGVPRACSSTTATYGRRDTSRVHAAGLGAPPDRPRRADERHRDHPDGGRDRDVEGRGLAAQGLLSDGLRTTAPRRHRLRPWRPPRRTSSPRRRPTVEDRIDELRQAPEGGAHAGRPRRRRRSSTNAGSSPRASGSTS